MPHSNNHMRLLSWRLTSLHIAMAFASPVWAQQAQPIGGKPVTAATKAANAAVLKALPFSDKADFEDAQRGFIAAPATVTI